MSSSIEGTASFSGAININDNLCSEQQSDFKAQNAFISSSILDLSNDTQCDACYSIICTDSASICDPITPSITIKIIDSYLANTDFKLTLDAFRYITNADISLSDLHSSINISYTSIYCDNLNIPNELMEEYTLAVNTTEIASTAHDEGWASVFGTVIIVIISTVCCCCGFGCVYRRYLEKKQHRNNSEVPDKSKASRTSARHSEREHSSKNKREYSRTITNTWDKTRKKVAEMVEKSKTISKPAIKPMAMNNLAANLNEFVGGDDDTKYAYDDEENEEEDPEIIEETLQSLKIDKLEKRTSAASLDASITAFSLTPLTYQTDAVSVVDFAMDTPQSVAVGNGLHSTQLSKQNSIIQAIPEERTSELSSSSGLGTIAINKSMTVVPQVTDTLTLAPTVSDQEPTQSAVGNTEITMTAPNHQTEITMTVTVSEIP